jgi:adenylylsulfate kinase
MAGAGKTVVGEALHRRMKTQYPNLVFLDGDVIRQVWGDKVGHTVPERKKNADRICRLCQMLDKQGIHVICSILSIFPESREWNRQNYRKYFEVFIDVNMDTLIQRDQKGLYSGALAGKIKNVVGIDIEFAAPTKSDIVIKNEIPREDFQDVVDKILVILPSGL